MSRAVTVWTISLDDPARDDAANWDLLDAEEQARAERFRFAVHRDRFTARRAAYRRILADRLARDPAALAFVAGPRGKPSLADGPCFNATHSEDWAMIAIADRACGIDLEAERPVLSDPAFMARVLTAAEMRLWQKIAPADRKAGGLQAWTRKEALVKALGLGLLREITELDLWSPAGSPSLWIDPIDSGHWRLAPLTAPTGYAAALAVRDDGHAPDIQEMRFNWR